MSDSLELFVDIGVNKVGESEYRFYRLLSVISAVFQAWSPQGQEAG